MTTRDSRRLERLESAVKALKDDHAPDASPEIFLVVVKSRQQIQLLDEMYERKGLKRLDPYGDPLPIILPPELIAGMVIKPPPARVDDDDDDDGPSPPVVSSMPPAKPIFGCQATELLSLLARWPFKTSRPMPQP